MSVGVKVMLCLRAHDQLKQIRSVTDPSGSITYSGGSGLETDDSGALSKIGCDDAAPTKPVWLASRVKRPIAAGWKGIKVTIRVHKGSRQQDTEWLYASPGVPPSAFAVNLKLLISRLTANTMEAGSLSIAIRFWLIHRRGGGWRWLVLRGSAARREQKHQSDGDKKSACRDFFHLSSPVLVLIGNARY